jgi:acetoin utilization deacetylase AcuC-like enzyme
MSLVVVTSKRFTDHITPPGHPERVERAETMEVAASRWMKTGGAVIEPRLASDGDLLRIHEAQYVESIKAIRGRAAMLDADTFTSPESDNVARLAAGAVLTAIDHSLDGAATRALALVRPPGHHAERNRAMGFCLYNNIAIGAAWARQRGIDRVAIVDFDVHHGNGTQHSFESDPSVLFISSHQFPFYPGTGAAEEVGRGPGAGFTVNLPMEAGASDDDFELAYREVVAPVLREFEPGLLLVSAGFDAHERDPLAGMRMTTEGFGRLTTRLLAVADDVCAGRVVFVTEGGYDTRALLDCIENVMALASGAERVVATPQQVGVGSTRGATTVKQAKRALGQYWKSL